MSLFLLLSPIGLSNSGVSSLSLIDLLFYELVSSDKEFEQDNLSSISIMASILGLINISALLLPPVFSYIFDSLRLFISLNVII